MPMATGIGDSAITLTRVRIGSVKRSGTVDEIAIEILMARHHEAMVPIVMIGGATLGLIIMSLGTVTPVHQTGDLQNPQCVCI